MSHHPATLRRAERAQVSSLPLAAMFGMCTLFLLACAACQRRLEHLVLADEARAPALDPASAMLLAKLGNGSPPKRAVADDSLL